ncbi:hypothetical protein DBR00_19140 [Pseudomonas sp. HMWF032]|uniref:DUF7000 family protein n=1 Tax=Pseudomonas sp. HMWF032 TaxID=2056866 RepID=UPI000D348D66|nr:hypothetical protein [Pseudomonas sp. HMWF032]PTS82223.1 hypothetical protein DBR00_19140 [Pseudomonas sp. HMWF032]PTT84251.1 hypothetical protein DBR41_07935 [Pseudomonas sp. HMWF010]
MPSKSLNSRIPAYKSAFSSGELQKTYQDLVGIVQNLRTEFSKKYKSEFLIANVLHGYIDFTYFYLQNSYLKKKKLKLAIVFNHKNANFELWLLGQTKDVQILYWRKLREVKWVNKEVMPEYSIFEAPLLLAPDFDSSTKLSESIHTQFESLSQEIFNTLEAYE